MGCRLGHDCARAFALQGYVCRQRLIAARPGKQALCSTIPSTAQLRLSTAPSAPHLAPPTASASCRSAPARASFRPPRRLQPLRLWAPLRASDGSRGGRSVAASAHTVLARATEAGAGEHPAARRTRRSCCVSAQRCLGRGSVGRAWRGARQDAAQHKPRPAGPCGARLPMPAHPHSHKYIMLKLRMEPTCEASWVCRGMGKSCRKEAWA